MGRVFSLDREIEDRIAHLSKVTGRGTEDQLREAILRGLEDMEDIADAEVASEEVARGAEPTASLEEVRRRLGLVD